MTNPRELVNLSAPSNVFDKIVNEGNINDPYVVWQHHA